MRIESITADIDRGGLPWFLHFKTEEPWRAYLDRPWIAFDFETTNLDKGSALNEKNRLLNVAWQVSACPLHFEWGDEFNQRDFLHWLNWTIENEGFIICHNAKFELQWLARMGVDTSQILCYDTLLGDYVLRGNRQNIRLDLGSVAKRWGYGGKEDIINAMMKGGVCPSDMPRELLRARAIKDVIQTVGIYRKQVQKLHKRKQLPVLFTRCIFTPVLADIESNGMALDKERVYEEYERAHHEYQVALKAFEKFTGGINHKSPDQMAHYLYGGGLIEVDGEMVPNPGASVKFKELHKWVRGGKKPDRNKKSKQFPNGRPKTDDKTLAKLRVTTKKQEKFLGHRKLCGKLNAELTKTLEFFKGVVDEYGGEFFGVFNQSVTKTHRLSSNGRKLVMSQFLDKAGHPKEKSTQFQNMPNQFKDCLCPRREGWKQGEIDGSQLEFRTAADLTGDTAAKQDIRNDVDVHTNSARALYELSDETSVTSEERRLAKPTTFRPLYGGSSGTPAQMRYFEFWKERYHEMVDEQTLWTQEVLNKKYLTTAWGMRYYWPYTRMSASGYIENTTQIFNYPIQAFATAEIIPIAVTYLWHRLRANKAKSMIVNTVHDSAVGEIAPGEDELWKQLGFWTFTIDVYDYLQKVYNYEFTTPLGAGVTIGSRWKSKDSDEWELNVEQNGECWWKGEKAA